MEHFEFRVSYKSLVKLYFFYLIQNIDHLTKWLAVTELIGIIVFNTVVLVLLLFPKKSSRMAFFVRNLALAGKKKNLTSLDHRRVLQL